MRKKATRRQRGGNEGTSIGGWAAPTTTGDSLGKGRRYSIYCTWPSNQTCYPTQATKASCHSGCSSSPIFHSAYFGTLEERTLSTEQELLDVFGHYTRREFKHGSYAVLAPNVTIKYMANTEKTRLKLKYRVYNWNNVLQWPESYSFED